MANQFNNVSKLKPGRSVFDLSYEKKFMCDMGQLIPVLCDEMVPGDKFKVTSEMVCRWQPLVAPILHEVNIFVHYFFVPYRLMWDNSKTDSWEAFITGGPEGDLAPIPPTWQPTDNSIGSLWDFMGFPTGVDPQGAYPLDFPRIAYNFIYNEYYRDQTLQQEVDLDNENILFRAWMKDYFTSALPWQQRGEAPSLPISGTSTALWPFNDYQAAGDTVTSIPIQPDGFQVNLIGNNPSPDMTAFVEALNKNTVDLSTATSFDIADLRTVVQVQKFLERNARVGARYTEFLGAHFSVSPKDSRLDRPEFCGAIKSNVVISEVLQTSGSPGDTDYTPTPQGNLAGHGITADRAYAGSYYAEEFGLMMGILSVMPKPAYQQGINRQWLRETKYDFYFPEFAHLSEQGIIQAELYASDVESENKTLFGYQGKYDEMRVKQNMVASSMRTAAPVSFDYWHLARSFDSPPILDETFITTGDSTKATGLAPSGTYIRKDIFAVQDEYTLIINMANRIKAIRPLPAASNPGLMDHF